MALQGNLRDFSATEILQLLGSQKKTGCLIMESNAGAAVVFVHDGRIISTRPEGLQKDDPLIAFLRRIHRLSDEQLIGLSTIHEESRRDLEVLLVDGRYIEPEDLEGLLERQILETLRSVMRWSEGTYRFDPNHRWENHANVRLGMDSVLIELARRADEEKRYARVFGDPHALLGVRDMPDPDEPLSEEETDLFSMIDGRHTVSELIEAAPLTDFEAADALNRLIEGGWVEFTGRREGAGPPVPPPVMPVEHRRRRGRRRSLLRELVVAAILAAAVLALRYGAHFLEPSSARSATSDVFAATSVRDLRLALELYHRDRGVYPERLSDLVDDRWITPDQVRVTGYLLHYRPLRGGADYQLDLVPDR
ncbi:MAG TPA: DUF4388 domain-containing protein [Candidatus Eisenbacteria bacterium]